jgi:hypothetical protein
MILGSHELVGTMETLKQPFVVLQKVYETDEVTKHVSSDMNHLSNDKDNNQASVSYNVQGVVTRKILFNKYPKVIMRSMQVP